MPWKDTINASLRRTTGYTLTTETALEREAALAQAAREAATQARRRTAKEFRDRAAAEQARRKAAQDQREAEREARIRAREAARAAREAAKVERHARGEDLPSYFDEHTRATIVRVEPWTMTGAPKLHALVEATRYVVRHGIPGDVVECGVWRGGSMQAIALTLLEVGDTTRELHLYDTFEGMPDPTAEDTRTEGGVTTSAEALLAGSAKDTYLWAIASLEDVRAGMSGVGYPEERVHYHPGLVEDTVPATTPETIAILRLDTDWYASTRHELDHLYDRLSPGGVLILDDYDSWDGARQATDEWLASMGEPLMLVPMGAGRIAVKPPSPQA